jgi:NAD(P)-dependent dehydrogenase (short-subunit alcohol dehydrogenase family)
MLRFQDLMAKFLDTQKSVMVSYLQGTGSVAPPAVPEPPPPPPPPAAQETNGQATPPAPAPPAAAPQSETPPAVTLDRAQLSAQLLDLVSKRTGYPREMLGMDLDLEADLGVDSIKRVEILGGLAESLGGSASLPNLEMEKLTGIRTLRGILDYLGTVLGEQPPPLRSANGATAESGNGQGPPPSRQLEVQRALVRLMDAPLPRHASLRAAAGIVLLTDDGRGVAREVAGRLADLGQKTALLRIGSATEDDGRADVFHADLTDPAAVDDLLRRVRKQAGPVAGLIHLLPLAEPPPGESVPERMRREVKSLYLLARELGDDLRRSGTEGSAVLLAATGLGGCLGFGSEPLADAYFPGHGGVIGFVKCLANEWPEVLVRVVDLDPSKPTAELADRLLSELGDPEGPLEVGYAGARRVTWEPFPAPLDGKSPAAPLLAPESTVLITGGARGITAAVALELARRYRPNLVLVGRSPLPPEAEPADTAPLTDAAALKAALITRLQRGAGAPVQPAAVEAAYQRLLQEREMRNNLAAMREAGAKVHYHAIDVRNEQALGGLLDDIERRFGGLDGVIHGAGVIEDKLVRDKTPESFDRVFGTKAESAWILSRLLRPQRLKFCVFFASIASRYGNKGQSDYAAANEVLSKLAISLDRRWPCRVFSVAWGPWSGVGMVADLAKHLTQRGLQLISPEQGPGFLIDELLHGRKGESEVIIAGGAEQVAQPPRGVQQPVLQVTR